MRAGEAVIISSSTFGAVSCSKHHPRNIWVPEHTWYLKNYFGPNLKKVNYFFRKLNENEKMKVDELVFWGISRCTHTYENLWGKIGPMDILRIGDQWYNFSVWWQWTLTKSKTLLEPLSSGNWQVHGIGNCIWCRRAVRMFERYVSQFSPSRCWVPRAVPSIGDGQRY